MAKTENRINIAPKDTVRQGWVNRLSPDFSWPYLQLMRADRPIGTWLLLWPCLWSIALASHVNNTDWRSALGYMLLFAVGAFVMRGAGCVVNDLADRKYDARVERTRDRPLPSGRVTVLQAFFFLGFLGLIGLVILLQLNIFTIWLGIASLLLVVIYPFMKRITWWPQIMLGLTFNWGALMGWAAISGTLAWPAILLYMAGIFWTLGYDTIYAHQDKEDDALIGVKSTALRLMENTPKWLVFFYGTMLLLFVGAGYLTHMGGGYYVGLGLIAGHVIWQVRSLKMDDGNNCLRLFRSNHHLGLILFLSIIAGHASI
ncbi:4-hydroxybenzoate polyprenyltransferase [hydrothermal vent metagenome]|uniref:4-hydroxybenzoate polyprenyltransferase n=1 Tax=hydrothermal vent metagenome TaxID=652676 RepID=A0A3B0SIX5_9ZZZZ